MNLALTLFIPLFTLVCANLIYVSGGSLWLSLMPLFGVSLILILVWRTTANLLLRQRTLSLICQLTLFVVAALLALQAHHALNGNVLQVNVGHLLPLFFGALALFVFHLMLKETVMASPRSIDVLTDTLAGPPLLTSLCTALILAAYVLLLLAWLQSGQQIEGLDTVIPRFLERGIIPPITLLMFCWGILLLLGKWAMNWYFRQVLNRADEPASTARGRISAALSELRADTVDLDQQLALLWQHSERSYLLPRYLSWAVPVLGFIGTVLGISLAADGIRRIISSQSGLSGLSSDLGLAIAPLGIAFDTTLIALSLSIVLVLFQTLVQRNEEAILTQLEEQLRERHQKVT